LAESGEEALDIIRDLNDTGIPLALVISDEMMPGMRGHMLIEQILNQSSKTHCILLTGYAASEIVNQITSQNPITCISKPWDAKELVALIKQVTQE
jgi:CheY-like chemotaxis protein